MRNHFILLLLAVFTLLCNAQNTISYTYDLAGNRLSRAITLGKAPVKENHQPTDSVVIKESLGKRSIKVFPNPTRGALGIEIIGMDTEENIQLILYSGTGTQLYNKPATEGLNPIDMTQYPQGWYILHIVSATERREYKIVKE